jgi:hypothetical protein
MSTAPLGTKERRFRSGYRTGTGHTGTCSLCKKPIRLTETYHLETGDTYVAPTAKAPARIVEASFKHWECFLSRVEEVPRG